MKKLTRRRIARLLAARATPEPPAGLADRIKAEIPSSIRLERQTFRPGRRWLMPPRVEGLHPSWLAAASVLLVAGVGMVAARIIPSQPDDVWKWMALSGVVHIEDVVVTAPSPAEPQGVTFAAAQARASKGLRIPVPARQRIAAAARNAGSADELGPAAGDAGKAPAAAGPEAAAMVATPPGGALEVRVSDGKEPLPGTTITAMRADAPEQGARAALSDAAGRASLRGLPPGEYRVRSEAQGFEPAEKTVEVAAGATSEVGVTMPQARMAEAVSVAGTVQGLPASVQAAAGNRPSRAQALGGIGNEENAVTVVVVDEAGRPCEGVTVTLERLGQGAFWARKARTDSGGMATFRGVPPASYRALAAAPAIAPAQVIVPVTSERAPTRAELHVRALPRH